MHVSSVLSVFRWVLHMFAMVSVADHHLPLVRELLDHRHCPGVGHQQLRCPASQDNTVQGDGGAAYQDDAVEGDGCAGAGSRRDAGV